ncbi:MAG TPA: nitrate reductase [Syntrophaceae bacterium]|nr:nitrate reductase [Syntrophaceae bacterium]
MYEFVRGPLLWVTFIIFGVGMIYRIVSLISLSLKKDKVVYNHFSFGWALRSILHWLLPLNQTVKQYPGYTIVAFTFHICLLVVPIFLLAHNILWYESWKISWWTISDTLADYMTLIMIAAALFLIVRRMVLPYVRIITAPIDYLLLIVAALPFVTGYFAYHQWINYKVMLIIHILCGELMLILIPFTKLAHMILFFFTRAHIGSEFGQRRGTKTW